MRVLTELSIHLADAHGLESTSNMMSEQLHGNAESFVPVENGIELFASGANSNTALSSMSDF